MAGAQPLAAKDTQPYRSAVYNVAFSYPKEDWVAVPAAGGNIALLMQKKGEASLALDFQVLRVALAPDEIDDTFKEIELEQLTQRAPHARVVSSALNEVGGHKVIVIRYGASGLHGRPRRHAVQRRQRRLAVSPDVRGDAGDGRQARAGVRHRRPHPGRRQAVSRTRRRVRVARTPGRVVAIVDQARTPWSRMAGLLGSTLLGAGDGLLSSPAWSIHTGSCASRSMSCSSTRRVVCSLSGTAGLAPRVRYAQGAHRARVRLGTESPGRRADWRAGDGMRQKARTLQR